MPRISRNDPCPCGSGKKYKNCCLRRDEAVISRELSRSPLERALFQKVLEFAELPRFNQDLTAAFHLYWGGAYAIEAGREMEPQDAQLMFEWFVNDYHTGDDRRYVLDLFIENQKATLAPEALEILNAWRQSVSGLFHIAGIQRSESKLELYDPLRQSDLVVHDEMLARSAQRDDLVIGRLYELGDAKRLSWMTMMLPRAFEPELVTYLMAAYTRYTDDHFQATWDQFLKEYGHLFMAFLLSAKADPLRTLIGPGTRYNDPARTRDKLFQATERLAAERARAAQAEQEEPGQLAPPEHRTTSGIVLPGEAPAPAAQPKEAAPKPPTILIPGRDF